MKFVFNNDPDAAFGTPGDMWKRFLSRKGATGDTFYDIEQSYLRLRNKPTWTRYLYAIGYTIGDLAQQARDWFVSIITPTGSYLTQEDGISFFTLEDDSGIIRKE